MKVLFDNPLFDGQLLRALGHASSGGADIGECLMTASRITSSDPASWQNEWTATADRISALAESSLAIGHQVSAREAFLRASNYYRAAYLFHFQAPVSPDLLRLYGRHVETFQKAGALFAPAFEQIAIPYEGTTLPGYFLRASDDSQPRPTLIMVSGYDSTAEELYFFGASAALAREYHCLIFDGPGQGGALIKQGLHLRPDWEVVVSAVVDEALRRPEVDPAKIVLTGLSLGGYLAPRAATGEHRLAACIADPGQVDVSRLLKARIPSPWREEIEAGDLSALEKLRSSVEAMTQGAVQGWNMRRNLFAHGIPDVVEWMRSLMEYQCKDRLDQISCPVLVTAAENDFLLESARELYALLPGPKTWIEFSSADGAGEHCEQGTRSLFNQKAFDWLDEVLHGITASED